MICILKQGAFETCIYILKQVASLSQGGSTVKKIVLLVSLIPYYENAPNRFKNTEPNGVVLAAVPLVLLDRCRFYWAENNSLPALGS